MKHMKKLFSWKKSFFAGPIQINLNLGIILILLFTILTTSYNLTSLGVSLWDEGDYLNAAAKVVEDGDVIYLGAGLKPLYILFISLAMFVFGVHDFVGNGVSALFGILLVYIVYLLGRKLFDERIGLMSSLVISTTGLFLLYSRVIYSDIVLTFFITLTVLYYLSTRDDESILHYVVLGFLIAVCFVVKNVGALTLPLIWLLEIVNQFFEKKRDIRKALKMLIIISAVSLAIIIFISIMYSVLSPEKMKSVTHSKSFGRLFDIFFKLGDSVSFVYYPLMYIFIGSPFLLGFLIFGIVRSIIIRKRAEMLILAWLIFYYIFFSLFPQHRIKLFVIFLPAMSIIIARGLFFQDARRFLKLFSGLVFLLLIISSFYLAIPVLNYKFLGFRTASQSILDLDANGVISTNAGVYKFYLRDLPLEIKALRPTHSYESLKALSEEGYTHLILDWRAPLINKTLTDEILAKYDPVFSHEDKSIYHQPTIVVAKRMDSYLENFEDYDRPIQQVSGRIFVFDLRDIVES